MAKKKRRKIMKKVKAKPVKAVPQIKIPEKVVTEEHPRVFFSFLFHHRYDYHDFLEPLLALPFAYGLLRILEGQFNTLTFIILFVLVLIYLPTLVVFTEYARKQ